MTPTVSASVWTERSGPPRKCSMRMLTPVKATATQTSTPSRAACEYPRSAAERGPGITGSVRLRAGGHAKAAGLADLSRLLAGTSATWVRNTVTGCCVCAAKAARSSWCRCRQRWGGRSTGPSATVIPGRSYSTGAAPGWTATRRWPPGHKPGPATASRRTKKTQGLREGFLKDHRQSSLTAWLTWLVTWI